MTRSRSVAATAIAALVLGTLGCAENPEIAKREYLRSGDQYVAQQKLNEAVIEYRNAIQQDPRFGVARAKLADVYFELGNLADALSEYVRAADLLPNDVHVQIRAAELLVATGSFEDAQTRAEKALGLEPGNVAALVVRGNALAGLQNLDDAVAQVEEAIRLAPDRSASYANLGILQVARGKSEEAEAAFNKAIETDPQSANPRLALASLYWQTGRGPEAERAFREILALNPRNVLANRALALFYLGSNRAAEAEQYLKAIVDVSGAESSARLTLADFYAGTNRPNEARALLEELARTDPAAFSPAMVRLAAISGLTGDRKKAYAILDEVLAKRPKDPDALLAKADLFFADERLDDAMAAVQAGVGEAPQSWRHYFALGKIHSSRREWDEATAAFQEVLKFNAQSVAARIELAQLSLLTGKPDDALRFAQEASARQPLSTDARILVTRALLVKGDAARAEPGLRQLQIELPTSPVVLAQFGALHAMKGDLPAARRAYESALASDPGQIDALSGLVALDIRGKRPDAARALVEGRLTKDANNTALLMLAVRLYRAIGDQRAAERALQQVIEVDPSQFDAYAMLGQLYASQHRLDEARVEFERLATVRPRLAVGAQTLVAMILQLQNKTQEAQNLYKRVLELDPRAAVAANNLAWLYVEGGGNLDIALQLAQTAKARMPDRPEVNDTLGWVYYKKGLATLAIPAFRESVGRDPENPTYHYHLGLAYLQAGDQAAARTALERAVGLNPNVETGGAARKVLASLGG